MSQVVLYIASSLDGYIARADGRVDWLEPFEASGQDFGYADFFARLGAVVMGSKTYEQVLGFPIAYPYASVESIVLTHRTLPTPPSGTVQFTQGDLAGILAAAKARHTQDIWLVGGGDLIAQCQQQQLIDEYELAIIPRLLGRGVRLFPPLDIDLTAGVELIETRSYPLGVAGLRYRKV